MFVIQSISERGYWSSLQGWVPKVEAATLYSTRAGCRMPVSADIDAEFIDAQYVADDFLLTEFMVGDEIFFESIMTAISIPPGHYKITGQSRPGDEIVFANTQVLLEGHGKKIMVLASSLL